MNEIYILDYPNRITEKKITEEGKKRLRELIKLTKDFNSKYDIKITYNDQN